MADDRSPRAASRQRSMRRGYRRRLGRPVMSNRTHNPLVPSRRSFRKPSRFRSVARTAAHSLVRGVFTAAGGALFAGALWWIQYR